MYYIRYATSEDIPAIKRIANQYKNEIGFVNRAALLEAQRRRELFVAALHDGQIAGFVNWHLRRDGWSTIYEIAVRRDLRGVGVGRALLYAVPTPTRLKCTTDNVEANHFYHSAGMRCVRTEAGRKRDLNVWERHVLYIWCQGNNKCIPKIAAHAGMAYGTRHIENPQAWPYMVDIHWRDYEWSDYLNKIWRWRPVMALTADFERPDQQRRLWRQVADLRRAGVLRIAVCPKFPGAVRLIPPGCVIAVSVPSSYAGFVPDYNELIGRDVHLLGGSPIRQRELLRQLKSAKIHVLSMDGNVHGRAAALGSVWSGEHDKKNWIKWEPGRVDYYTALAISASAITDTMERAVSGARQLELFSRAVGGVV